MELNVTYKKSTVYCLVLPHCAIFLNPTTPGSAFYKWQNQYFEKIYILLVYLYFWNHRGQESRSSVWWWCQHREDVHVLCRHHLFISGRPTIHHKHIQINSRYAKCFYLKKELTSGCHTDKLGGRDYYLLHLPWQNTVIPQKPELMQEIRTTSALTPIYPFSYFIISERLVT